MGRVLTLKQYGGKDPAQTRAKLYKAIMSGQDFRTGEMKGVNYRVGPSWPLWIGDSQLSEEWTGVLIQDHPDFVVFSLATPIGWHVPADSEDESERWVVPDVSYSATTSRHQNIVRTALIFNRTEPLGILEEARNA